MTEIIRNRVIPTEDPGTLQPWSLNERYPVELGEYEMQKQIGAGKTAAVWAARVRATGEQVAIKVLNIQYLKGDKGRAVSEVLTQRALHHPNTLPGLAYFDTGDSLYSVMPYIHGGAISDIISQRHPNGLPQAAALTVAYYVLRALDHMHQHGIMHRDIKAANVLVDEKGHVYVADFGVVAPVDILSGSTHRGGDRALVIARHRAAMSDFVGTPAWMAPEVVNADEAVGYDERADIWSFGILLLEMANGEVPHGSEKNLTDVVMAITNDAPPEFQAPDDGRAFHQGYGRLVSRCLQKLPNQRPSASELLKDPIFERIVSESKLVHTLFTRSEEESSPGLVKSSSTRRMPIRCKSMKQSTLEGVLKDDVDNILEMLAKAVQPSQLLCSRGTEESSSLSSTEPAKDEHRSFFHRNHHSLHHQQGAHPSECLTRQDLVSCKGLIFGRAHKHGGLIRSSAKGIGFAIARLVNEEGETYWTAPSFLKVYGSGSGLAVGAEELSFIIVLREADLLLDVAASKASMKTNGSPLNKSQKVSLQLQLGNAVHTTKFLSFSEGRMLGMTVLGWDLEPDDELNERVYGDDARPEDILTGRQRPPQEFDRLVDELQHLEREGLPEMHTQSHKHLSVTSGDGPSIETLGPATSVINPVSVRYM